MFCNDIGYSRYYITEYITENNNGQKILKTAYLGGASAAYVREARKISSDDFSLKITTKIALVCHVAYSIFKGLLQGLCSIFLAGEKGEKLALHAKYNLIFTRTTISTANYFIVHRANDLAYLDWKAHFNALANPELTCDSIYPSN